jgi:hypothetical protein
MGVYAWQTYVVYRAQAGRITRIAWTKMARPETIAPVSTASIFVSRVAENIRDIVGEGRDGRDEQQKGKDYENGGKRFEFVHVVKGFEMRPRRLASRSVLCTIPWRGLPRVEAQPQ